MMCTEQQPPARHKGRCRYSGGVKGLGDCFFVFGLVTEIQILSTNMFVIYVGGNHHPLDESRL